MRAVNWIDTLWATGECVPPYFKIAIPPFIFPSLVLSKQKSLPDHDRRRQIAARSWAGADPIQVKGRLLNKNITSPNNSAEGDTSCRGSLCTLLFEVCLHTLKLRKISTDDEVAGRNTKEFRKSF
jgi:hypothetical protein